MSDQTQERADRLKVIMIEMDAIVREIGPKWIRLAHLRRESQMIIQELTNVDGK